VCMRIKSGRCRVTPAMEAGVSVHWSIEEIVGLLG
jgi:hypothetical protein